MTDWEFTNNLKAFDASTNERVGYFTNDDEPLPIREGRKPRLQAATSSMLKKLSQGRMVSSL